jgi:alpha-glucoside transport system substrate-binding protein
MSFVTTHRKGFPLGILFLFLLTACLARPTAPPSPPTVATPDSLVFTTPTPAPNTLIVVGGFVGDAEIRLRRIFTDFTAASGIEVQYYGQGEVAEQLRELVEAHQTPDIILLPKAQWLHELAGAGAIAPLAPRVAAAVEQNFSEGWQREVSHEGTFYGVPFDANLKSLLWYRPSPTLTIPADFEGLLALAEERAAIGQSTFTLTGGEPFMLTDWFEHVLLATAGGEVYDGLIAHELAWTDPRVVAAAEDFVTLLQPDYIIAGAEGAQLPLNADALALTLTPPNGDSRLWLGQGSIVARYAETLALTAGEDYEVAPFPTDGSVVVIGSLAVGTNGRAETTELLLYLTQPEAVTAWVQSGGFLSPNLALSPDVYPSEVARAEAELLVSAAAIRPDLSDQLPPHLGYPYLGNQLREMLLRPDEIELILGEIEQVAIRDQGRIVP